MRALLSTVIILLIMAGNTQTEIPAFDADRAFNYLEMQCGFGPRNPGSIGYENCKEWLVATLTDLGCEIYQQKFDAIDLTLGEKYQLTNIIARIDGPGNPLMLCAHWDTRPRADRDLKLENRDKPISGANDGASGVAVLLEIARIANDQPPPRTLIIALFDGEDMGRTGHPEEYALGSKYWAGHQLPEPVDEAILLDMVGDADLELPVEYYSEQHSPLLRRRLWELAHSMELPAFIDAPGPAVHDDHVPLQQVGIPAVDIIDFDYPYWHTLEDTPDKCSPESLGQVGMLLMEYIYGN